MLSIICVLMSSVTLAGIEYTLPEFILSVVVYAVIGILCLTIGIGAMKHFVLTMIEYSKDKKKEQIL